MPCQLWLPPLTCEASLFDNILHLSCWKAILSLTYSITYFWTRDQSYSRTSLVNCCLTTTWATTDSSFLGRSLGRFASRVPVILGTPTTERILNIMTESEITKLSVAWATVRTSTIQQAFCARVSHVRRLTSLLDLWI